MSNPPNYIIESLIDKASNYIISVCDIMEFPFSSSRIYWKISSIIYIMDNTTSTIVDYHDNVIASDSPNTALELGVYLFFIFHLLRHPSPRIFL